MAPTKARPIPPAAIGESNRERCLSIVIIVVFLCNVMFGVWLASWALPHSSCGKLNGRRREKDSLPRKCKYTHTHEWRTSPLIFLAKAMQTIHPSCSPLTIPHYKPHHFIRRTPAFAHTSTHTYTHPFVSLFVGFWWLVVTFPPLPHISFFPVLVPEAAALRAHAQQARHGPTSRSRTLLLLKHSSTLT
jgi:hypothetical protein